MRKTNGTSLKTSRTACLFAAALPAILLWLLPAQEARADCTAVMGNVNFGNVDFLAPAIPMLTQTQVSITCNRNAGSNTSGIQKFNVCLAVDGGRGTLQNEVDPRRLCLNGGSCTQGLTYNLYLDPNHTMIWGTTSKTNGSNLNAVITIPEGAHHRTETFPIYAKIEPSQTGIANGNYTADFSAGSTALTYIATNSDTPRNCRRQEFERRSSRFPFVPSATVINNCRISNPQDIRFGNVVSTATNLQGQASFDVSCTAGIPYNIGLQPANNNRQGRGSMKALQPGNTDTVPYRLRSQPGLNGQVWGNENVTAVGTGNGVGGTGTGLPQRYNVYATVDSADYRVGEYKDTVTINVYY